MGQKVHPHGLRVGVIKDWDSRWYAGKFEFGDSLVEDHKIRKVLKKRLYQAGVSKIEIEKAANRIRLFIHAAKPGLIIGKGGAEIEKIKAQVEKLTGKTVNLNIVEVKRPDMDAQLVAENIASQLERRISFRKAMKQAMGRTMKMGARGIKTNVSGRLGGAEIARSEHYHEGTIPLQTIRADIDYGFAEADTTYGKLGVKVWIYKGEILAESRRANNSGSKSPVSAAKVAAPKNEVAAAAAPVRDASAVKAAKVEPVAKPAVEAVSDTPKKTVKAKVETTAKPAENTESAAVSKTPVKKATAINEKSEETPKTAPRRSAKKASASEAEGGEE